MTQSATSDLAAWSRDTLRYEFKDLALLDRALTHSTTLKANYQRLEFLGDRVLGVVIAALLYREHDGPEGLLTVRLHGLVEGTACAEVARSWQVADRLKMERSAVQKGLGRSDNVLGDVAEAIIAAVYLDGGFAAAEAFVQFHWAQLLKDGPRLLYDPKTKLQNWILQRSRRVPEYSVVDRSGADHKPWFKVQVVVHGQEPGIGEGSNKREAEKAAAQDLLDRLKI